jgi:hypothetical protein
VGIGATRGHDAGERTKRGNRMACVYELFFNKAVTMFCNLDRKLGVRKKRTNKKPYFLYY